MGLTLPQGYPHPFQGKWRGHHLHSSTRGTLLLFNVKGGDIIIYFSIRGTLILFKVNGWRGHHLLLFHKGHPHTFQGKGGGGASSFTLSQGAPSSFSRLMGGIFYYSSTRGTLILFKVNGGHLLLLFYKGYPHPFQGYWGASSHLQGHPILFKVKVGASSFTLS